jgi:hypothetical protein
MGQYMVKFYSEDEDCFHIVFVEAESTLEAHDIFENTMEVVKVDEDFSGLCDPF